VAAGVVLCACLIATECQLRFWRDTESLFTRALAVTQDNGGAHLVLAGYFADQHRLKEAAVQFREALRLDQSPFVHTYLDRQNNAKSRLSLAQVFESQDCDQEALTEYQEALRLDPASVEGHNNLGNLLDKMGRADEALRHYFEAVRLDPNAPLARDNLGTLLVKLGRFDEAMEQYTEAARLKPDDPRPHYLTGKAWLRRGQSAEAIRQLQEALRLDPNDLRTLTCLARVLAADRDLRVLDGTEAVRLAERANTLTGATQPFVLDTLAMAYAETGRFTEAQKTLVTAIGILESTGAHPLIAEMQQRLECYRSGQPYRESYTNATSLPETDIGHSQKQDARKAKGNES